MEYYNDTEAEDVLDDSQESEENEWADFEKTYTFDDEVEELPARNQGMEDADGFQDAQMFLAMSFLNDVDSEDYTPESDDETFDAVYRNVKNYRDRSVTDHYDYIEARKAQERAKPYETWIGKASQISGIDPSIFKGQLYQESRFNPNAVSSAGAKGISQFMPATAKEYGIDPSDPKQSILAMGKKMKGLLKMYNGNMEHALMAYNWGEGNLNKYLSGKKKMPKETQEYVNSVYKNASLFGPSQYGLSVDFDMAMQAQQNVNFDLPTFTESKQGKRLKMSQYGLAKMIIAEEGVDAANQKEQTKSFWDVLKKIDLNDVLSTVNSVATKGAELINSNIDTASTLASNAASERENREQMEKFYKSLQQYSNYDFIQNDNPIFR